MLKACFGSRWAIDVPSDVRSISAIARLAHSEPDFGFSVFEQWVKT